ncbi:MAG: DNA mismatch repair endonuclease MutL [Clostridia bacterium]|nr:DNA mismatch repair endonuclease MutL [Clostridia bacterium]
MGIINVLDKQTANLIAAGEVVERPSSAIKEMLENCADAGATTITVEIKNGGTTYIRVTDDGCGMIRDDVPKCIMRHATSKIRTESDLEAIGTFGFRGEALAAISSVAKVRILTKSDQEQAGTLFECNFGEQVLLEDAGCPKGTTITVENIFENVPARRKFLKKDSTEALSVGATCEKFALSRPDIALTFISDNNIKMQTPGDGDLKSAVYACLGREFASMLFPVDYTLDNIRIHGFIAKPEFSRPNRNMQNFFVNNRYIRSRTMMAALEEGFRGFCPTGKFPACVLFCDIDLRLVDINVHPAKLEIKFSDERRVFDSIYFSVKNALSTAVRFSGFTEDDSPAFPEVNKQDTNEVKADVNSDIKIKVSSSEERKESKSNLKPVVTKKTEADIRTETANKAPEKTLDFLNDVYDIPQKQKLSAIDNSTVNKSQQEKTKHDESENPSSFQQSITPIKQEEIISSKQLSKPIYIGEAFDTYIVCQHRQSLYIIDKHAAHERIIYEKLKSNDYENGSQYLLEPLSVILTPKEAQAAIDNKKYFEKIGFEYDDFGMNTVIIRSLPTPIAQQDAADVFTFLTGKLAEGNTRSAGEIFDRALFTAACRAAIKGKDKYTDMDNKYIIEEIFSNEAVLYCPHGRPVIYELTKQKLDKIFDRL